VWWWIRKLVKLPPATLYGWLNDAEQTLLLMKCFLHLEKTRKVVKEPTISDLLSRPFTGLFHVHQHSHKQTFQCSIPSYHHRCSLTAWNMQLLSQQQLKWGLCHPPKVHGNGFLHRKCPHCRWRCQALEEKKQGPFSEKSFVDGSLCVGLFRNSVVGECHNDISLHELRALRLCLCCTLRS